MGRMGQWFHVIEMRIRMVQGSQSHGRRSWTGGPKALEPFIRGNAVLRDAIGPKSGA